MLGKNKKKNFILKKKDFEFCLAYNTPRPPMSVYKKFHLNAVLPAIRNIYTNVLFYYIDWY